jgi:hypothetical protein
METKKEDTMNIKDFIGRFESACTAMVISYINVQKSTDFKPQEKRGGGQIGRKKERKKEKS